jgi:hypothetical protein
MNLEFSNVQQPLASWSPLPNLSNTPPLSKWFYDTSTGVATGAVRCDYFVG